MRQHAEMWGLLPILRRGRGETLGVTRRQHRRLPQGASTATLSVDIHKLNPMLAGCWVLHVLCFVVPRQILELGDPSRRSCDACESFGAMLKKIIKQLTCRLNVRMSGKSLFTGANNSSWTQTFTRGYTKQAFRRVCVRASMIHGDANARYTKRQDERLETTAKNKPGYGAAVSSPQLSIAQAMTADSTVLTKAAAMAVCPC
eukprot:6190449-Pleurochrysis_carterae.AAC.1